MTLSVYFISWWMSHRTLRLKHTWNAFNIYPALLSMKMLGLTSNRSGTNAQTQHFDFIETWQILTKCRSKHFRLLTYFKQNSQMYITGSSVNSWNKNYVYWFCVYFPNRRNNWELVARSGVTVGTNSSNTWGYGEKYHGLIRYLPISMSSMFFMRVMMSSWCATIEPVCRGSFWSGWSADSCSTYLITTFQTVNAHISMRS